MQLTENLGAKRAIAKADWVCWKKSEEQFERIHRPFLFDLDDNDQEQACWDECTRESCNADVSQMAKKMDMLPYSLSVSPSSAWVLHQGLCLKGKDEENENKYRETRKEALRWKGVKN